MPSPILEIRLFIWALVESLMKELEDHLFFQSVWMVAYLTPSDLLHSCSVLCLECGCHRALFLYRGHWAVAGHIEVVIAKGSRQRWLLVSNGNIQSSVTRNHHSAKVKGVLGQCGQMTKNGPAVFPYRMQPEVFQLFLLPGSISSPVPSTHPSYSAF